MTRRSSLTLMLGGDVMIGRGIDQILPRSCTPILHEPYVRSALEYVVLAEDANGPIPRGVEPDYVWGDLLRVLARERPDVRLVNLESALTTSDDAEPKGINYRAHPDNVAVLTAAGIDCCTLANNHVLDWGDAGLLDTLDALARVDVRAVGAGLDLDAAQAPALLELGDDARVVVVAMGVADSGIPRGWAAGVSTPGVHLLPDLSDRSVARVASLVARAKQPGDLAVASIHWGDNWGYEIPHAHRRFAHALVKHAGIDVVHGHSSHHPRPVEVHEGRPILYGCGDLLNDYEGIHGHEEYRADLVLAWFATLETSTGRLLRLAMAPLQIRRFRLVAPSSADRDWLADTLHRECARFGLGVRLRGDVLELA